MKGTMTKHQEGNQPEEICTSSQQLYGEEHSRDYPEVITQPDTHNVSKEEVKPLTASLYPGVVALTLRLSLLVSTCPWSSLHTILAATLVSIQSRWNPS